MTRRTPILFLLVALATARPVPPLPVELGSQSEDPGTAMMEADRAFAADTAERGIDGWLEWMADDAARMPAVGADMVTGREAIRALDGALLSNPALRLEWEPTAAHTFADGRYGITTGPYRIVRTDDGSVLGSGHYVTFWRHDTDGWRVIFDTGAADD